MVARHLRSDDPMCGVGDLIRLADVAGGGGEFFRSLPPCLSGWGGSIGKLRKESPPPYSLWRVAADLRDSVAARSGRNRRQSFRDLVVGDVVDDADVVGGNGQHERVTVVVGALLVLAERSQDLGGRHGGR